MKSTVKLLGITGGIIAVSYSVVLIILGASFLHGGSSSRPADSIGAASLILIVFGLFGITGAACGITGGMIRNGVLSGVLMLSGAAACGLSILPAALSFITAASNIAWGLIFVCISVVLLFSLGGLLSIKFRNTEEPKKICSRKVKRNVRTYGNTALALSSDDADIISLTDGSLLVSSALYCRAVGNGIYAIDIEKNMIIIDADTAAITLKTKDPGLLSSTQKAIFISLKNYGDYSYVYET
jgi:hypothetical protein